MPEPAPFRLVSDGRVLYEPTAKQWLFHQHPAKNKLYGGAAGCGKSHALRWDLHMACLLVPKLKVLLLRRTFPELNDTHIERAMLEAPLLGAEYLKSEHKMRFPNGSIEQYGHVQDDAALSRYLSTEYDRIAFDELVTFTKLQFLMLGSRLRTVVSPPRGGGPGGGGAARPRGARGGGGG